MASIAEEGAPTHTVTTSSSFDPMSFDMSNLVKEIPVLANYVKGTMAQYSEHIPPGPAINAVIDEPMGSG